MAHFRQCAEKRQRRLTARIERLRGGHFKAEWWEIPRGKCSGFRLRVPASLTPARRLKFDSPRCSVLDQQTMELARSLELRPCAYRAPALPVELVQRACTSPTGVRFTRPAPDFDGGIGRMAWALDCGSSHESSILSSRPKWADRIWGLPTALTPSASPGSGQARSRAFQFRPASSDLKRPRLLAV